MNIYGMRSNDKLKTLQTIKENTGLNKFFSFTGFDTTSVQDEVSAQKCLYSFCSRFK